MKVYCNCCGKEIRMEENMRYALEDYIVIEKIWGYFSKKDTTLHSFVICEECYDKMVEKFAIPPEVIDVTEL